MAANVVTHGKTGELVIKLKFKQIGESNQVAMTHSLKFLVPTMRGRIVEESASDTPLHVGRGGKLSLYPGEQTEMFPQGGTTDAARNGELVIKAQVPLAEVTDYQTELKAMTGGQGRYAIEFSHYEAVPAQVQKQLVDAYKPRVEED